MSFVFNVYLTGTIIKWWNHHSKEHVFFLFFIKWIDSCFKTTLGKQWVPPPPPETATGQEQDSLMAKEAVWLMFAKYDQNFHKWLPHICSQGSVSLRRTKDGWVQNELWNILDMADAKKTTHHPKSGASITAQEFSSTNYVSWWMGFHQENINQTTKQDTKKASPLSSPLPWKQTGLSLAGYKQKAGGSVHHLPEILQQLFKRVFFS